MKNSDRPKRSVFLEAAKLQAQRNKDGDLPVDGDTRSNRWACLNIEKVCGEWGHGVKGLNSDDSVNAKEFFADHFEPRYHLRSNWWPDENHNEERILALLLCAEMLRR
jgi:hypothetical protein